MTIALEAHAPRRLKYTENVLSNAFRYYAAGSSTHAVALALSLTMEESEELLRIYVDTSRARFAPDRIAKRQAMRNKLGTAAGFLESIYSGTHPAISGKEGAQEIEPSRLKAMRAVLGLQVKAASAVMASAKTFASESLLDILVERAQEEAEPAQETIFTMAVEAGENGGATISYMPPADERRTGT